MKKYLPVLLILVLVLSVLVACGGTNTAEPAVAEPAAAVEEAQPEPTEVPEEPTAVPEPTDVPEPTEEPAPTEEPEPEMAELDPTALDAGFETFLGGMEGYNTIGLEDLNLALAEDPPPFILDVREPVELEENGHIPGAVNIPLREVADNLQYLPSFDTPIVSYCGSGWRCTIALTMLEALGWENVKGLTGGSFGGWVDVGYEVVEGAAEAPMELNAAEPDPALVAAAQETLHNVPEGFGVITADDLNIAIAENPDLILIDVRRLAEVAENGAIDAPNVLFIPLEDFIANKDQWPADLEAPIVTYCGSGHRSTIAMTILWANGYTDVHSLKGGFGGWAEAGYPTVEVEAAEGMETGATDLDTAFATFLTGMEGYNTIGLDDLNLALAEDAPPFILDVREPGELEENGHIPGAVNIPLREVADNLQYLPSFDTPIVSYCGSGWRCTIALAALEALGWEDVKGLKGGSFSGWVDAGYEVVEGAAEEPMELNAAEPDPALVAAMQEMLHNVPEGFGVITADDLNIAIAENPDLILIDVRRPEEVAEQGAIDAPNVLFIPLEDFITDKDQWPADPDAPIVVYCGSGHRSTIAMTILWSYGYTDVHSLKGGFSEWVDAGYPVVEVEAQ
jgi:rhodanese-related sulfurtransferase